MPHNTLHSTSSLTIGELAKAAGVHIETIRYYQKRGLLPKPIKPATGYTRYPHTLIARIFFIKSAQQLSFSLADIATLLTLADQATDKNQVRELTQIRLAQVQETRRHLDFVEATLTRWINECEHSDENECCPIIAHINQTDTAPFSLT